MKSIKIELNSVNDNSRYDRAIRTGLQTIASSKNLQWASVFVRTIKTVDGSQKLASSSSSAALNRIRNALRQENFDV